MDKKANILVIQADQLAASALSMYGGIAKTPNLDRIAAAGTVFDSFYCNFPLCGPSRASMMTGQLASRIGVYDNAAEFPTSEPTMAHVMRNAGYRTCLSGKMHFIGPDQLHGFDERLTADIYPADYAWLTDWDTGQKGFEPMRNTIENGGVCAWNMQIAFDEDATNRAVAKLYDYARAPADPFFFFVSLSHPHPPFLMQPEFWEMYSDDDIPPPRTSAIPADELDGLSHRCRQMIGLLEDQVSDEHARLARRGYYASISYFDAKVGQIIAALEMSGLAENTAIFITSDHGEMLGERGLWGKDCFFDWGAKVPLIVKLPQLSQTQRVTAPASLLDLLPTFATMAGQGAQIAPLDLMGKDLLGLMSDTADTDTARVFAEYTADATGETVVMIRAGSHKYIYARGDGEQLYDLRADPDERENLADRQPRMIAEFRRDRDRVWDLPATDTAIRSSQRKRKLVARALNQGKKPSWDLDPAPDYSEIYVRTANGHEVVDRKIRVPAMGYEMPRNY